MYEFDRYVPFVWMGSAHASRWFVYKFVAHTITTHEYKLYNL